MSAISKSSARNNSLRGKVAVIGIGMSPVGKVPGKSPLWLAADAAKKALADAGIQKREIDGVLSSHAMASPFHRFSIAFSEYFGIQPTFSNTLQVSGATAATMRGFAFAEESRTACRKFSSTSTAAFNFAACAKSRMAASIFGPVKPSMFPS